MPVCVIDLIYLKKTAPISLPFSLSPAVWYKLKFHGKTIFC